MRKSKQIKPLSITNLKKSPAQLSPRAHMRKQRALGAAKKTVRRIDQPTIAHRQSSAATLELHESGRARARKSTIPHCNWFVKRAILSAPRVPGAWCIAPGIRADQTILYTRRISIARLIASPRRRAPKFIPRGPRNARARALVIASSHTPPRESRARQAGSPPYPGHDPTIG